MELVILSGMSGAGKSMAANYLEDMGFYCIDNLPPPLLEALIQALSQDRGEKGISQERYALVMDVRSAKRFGKLAPFLLRLRESLNQNLRIVFLEAGDQAIISRYKQSRRNHPLAKELNLSEAIEKERDLLYGLREMATDLIDTTDMKGGTLRDLLYDLFHEPGAGQRMRVFIQSFGFKYGIPLDADSLLDVRFIPNPFYLPELRDLSGLDEEVKNYVFSFSETSRFLDLQEEFYRFSLPCYQREGKVRLSIAVGCTGGRHRSVAMAEDLRERFIKMGYSVHLDHRDILRDPQGGL